jgi:cytochrome P450
MADSKVNAGMGERPSIDLVDPELYASGDPHAVWRWLRANDPAHWHEPSRGMPGFWAITRYDDVISVYSRPDLYSSAQGILLRPTAHGPDPGGGRTLALTDPPRHRRLRSLVNTWFTERGVRALRDDMRETASAVVKAALAREHCDFVSDVAARLPLYVICGLMGVPESDRDHVLALTTRAFGAGEPGPRRMAHVHIMEYFSGLADSRRRRPADDIVSVLATAQIDGRPLTEQELLFNCDNVLVGGTENVRIAAAGGMHQFLESPAQWALLRATPGLLPGAVEEVLRWTCTPTHIMRTALGHADILGRRISPGDRVALWLPSANRDEMVFAEPDRFDIQRAPNRHLALGHGEHFCLGGVLARAELRILYEEIASRVELIEPAGPPKRLSSIVVNGFESLPVRLAPGRSR